MVKRIFMLALYPSVRSIYHIFHRPCQMHLSQVFLSMEKEGKKVTHSAYWTLKEERRPTGCKVEMRTIYLRSFYYPKEELEHTISILNCAAKMPEKHYYNNAIYRRSLMNTMENCLSPE